MSLALSSLVLIPILIAAQFGQAFYVYNQLSTQIRAGARYASRRTFRCGDRASIDKYNVSVANMVRFGNPDGTGTLLDPELRAEQVEVRIKDQYGAPAGRSNPPASVSVSIVNYRVDTLFRRIDLDHKPILEFPFAGQYAPGEIESSR